MIKISDLNDLFAEVVIVQIKPIQKSINRLLVEATYAKYLAEANQEKQWGSQHTYRLDRRPEHQGGNQVHIHRKNDSWAYRFDGSKSEPHKYTLPATNTVKDIVRDVFKLGPDVKIEAHVISASAKEIIIEATFV